MSGILQSPIFSCNNNTYNWIIDNNGSNSVFQFLISNGQLINTIPVGIQPSGICIDKDYVWVSNYGDNTVSQISISTGQVQNTIALLAGSTPSGICNDGTYVWTSNSGTHTISQISISSATLLENIIIANSQYLHDICTDGTYVWITDFLANSIYKYYISSGEINTISVGQNPFGICTDGTYVWVANSGDNTMSQILISSGLKNTISVGQQPYGICNDSTYVWVANHNDNTVSQFLISSNAVINTIPVGKQPYGLFDDGNYVWVCNNGSNGSNTISKIQIPKLQPPPCFKKGSKILTNKGYLPIEQLRPGDLVKTLLHDFKPIYMIGKKDIYHRSLNNRAKEQLYRCSKEKYPELFEDLVLTGCHCILVDEFASERQREKSIEVNGRIFVTDNKYRVPTCADEKAYVYETPGIYTIYHLALENESYYQNYGIYANGLLVETCSKRYLKELSNMEVIQP